MPRSFAALLSLFLLAACGPYPMSVVKGEGSTDGRDFGVHHLDGSSCRAAASPGDPPAVVLSYRVSTGRNAQYAEVRVAEDVKTRGVDVQLPWSHVLITPAQCTDLDARVAWTPRRPVTSDAYVPEGLSGAFHAHCTVPETGDVLDADATFEGC